MVVPVHAWRWTFTRIQTVRSSGPADCRLEIRSGSSWRCVQDLLSTIRFQNISSQLGGKCVSLGDFTMNLWYLFVLSKLRHVVVFHRYIRMKVWWTMKILEDLLLLSESTPRSTTHRNDATAVKHFFTALLYIKKD